MDIGELQLSLNILWVVIASILVFFMQAGFALLESGMVRSKNAVNVVMKNFIDMCFGALGFWLIGYGLMFGSNPSGWIGTDHFALNNGSDWDYTFLLFQMMFAATAATIVSGAIAERIHYGAYIICAAIITTFIYTIYGSWAWGGSDSAMGWLRSLGYIDFAGSTVVHAIGGWCALAGVIVLGPRLGRFSKPKKILGMPATSIKSQTLSHLIPGHNLPMMVLGAFILWFGWFGFNAGSALEVNASIGKIALNTHLSATAGVVGAMVTLLITRKPFLIAFIINGGLGGLVAICAGCAYMDPVFAILTGFIAGVITLLGVLFLERLRLDDAIGAVAVHAFSGTWGALAVGLFHKDHLFDMGQFWVQVLGVSAAFLWAFPTAWLMFKGVDRIIKLRVSTKDERRGLDYTEHYEIAYPEFQGDLLHAGKR